jgi:hypothetical protein
MTENLKFPESIMEQILWMFKECGIPPDAPTSHDYGKLASNLILLKMGSKHGPEHDAMWQAFIEHLLYPFDKPFPDDLFYAPKEGMAHYALFLKHFDDIYQQCGEEE